MKMFPIELAREWTLAGYMNMASSCRGLACNPHVFPVTMSDGSQRTYCLDHLPDGALRHHGCRIIVGQDPMPPLEKRLAEMDRTLAFLPMALREMVLHNSCLVIREGRARA